MELVSNCCGSGTIYTEYGICPDCKEHCEFIDLDLLCEMCGETEMTEDEKNFSDICNECREI